MVDTTVADRKRALWDYVVKNNLLTSTDKLTRAKAQSLLNDKTIFLYNFAKLNGEPVRTRWTQDIVLSDPGDRVLFCACNQYLGKSTALDFDASTEFVRDHSKRWVGLLVSGSLKQSEERMENIKLYLDSMDIDYKTKILDVDAKGKSNATQLSYYFMDPKTGKTLYSNLLICCPHTSSALGYPADNIWLDEVDFWEDVRGGQIHFFNQVLVPRTFFTEGKIKGYSNPNGKDRMMYYLWNQKTEEGLPAWHRYQFNYWDKTNPTQKGFDKAIIGFTKNEIESTSLAAFTTTEGSFFSKEEIDDMHCAELDQKGDSAGYGRECAFFLDVGSVHDQSMLVGGYIEDNPDVPEMPLIKAFYVHKYPVGYPIARVIGVDSAIDTEDGWDDYVEDNPSVKQVMGEYPDIIADTKYQPLFGFDATGQAGLLPLFTTAGIEAQDITFTGKLKWHMGFIKRAKERDVNTVRGCDYDHQFSKVVVKKGTSTNYKQIHHENENDLDDCFDATMGFVHLIESPDLSSGAFAIVGHKSPENVDEEKKDQESREEDKRLEGQYIPSFMNRDALSSWMDKRDQLR